MLKTLNQEQFMTSPIYSSSSSSSLQSYSAPTSSASTSSVSTSSSSSVSGTPTLLGRFSIHQEFSAAWYQTPTTQSISSRMPTYSESPLLTPPSTASTSSDHPILSYETQKVIICSQCTLQRTTVNWTGVDSYSLKNKVVLTVLKTNKNFMFMEDGVYNVDFDGTTISSFRVSDHNHKNILNEMFG
jgi:hypothetical protein